MGPSCTDPLQDWGCPPLAAALLCLQQGKLGEAGSWPRLGRVPGSEAGPAWGHCTLAPLHSRSLPRTSQWLQPFRKCSQQDAAPTAWIQHLPWPLEWSSWSWAWPPSQQLPCDAAVWRQGPSLSHSDLRSRTLKHGAHSWGGPRRSCQRLGRHRWGGSPAQHGGTAGEAHSSGPS